MSHADTCRPRLYVYDLPARYRDDREGGFGKPYNHTSNPTGVQLWQTAEFALGDLLLHRATAYRCRTTDAQSADLFFVPAYSSRQHNRPTERLAEGGNLRALHSRLRKVQVNRCSMLALNGGPTGGAIRGNCSALEARGGADHILINPRNGAPYESHPYAELDYLDPRFGNATLLDLMEPGAWTTRWPGDYKPEARYHSIPHPSLIHLDPAISHLPWRSTHPRGVLVAGAFGVAHGSKAIIGLRTALQRACLASPDGVCRFHKLGDKVAARAGGGAAATGTAWTQYWGRGQAPPASSTSFKGIASPPAGSTAGAAPGSTAPPPPVGPAEPGWHSIARLYWNATFCMHPPGDAVSRKAIIDSLLLGCIPVLFHEGQAVQWPWHWGRWRADSSVLLDMQAITQRKLDPIGALRSIPAARVQHMQSTIAAHAHVLQYAAVDTASLPAIRRVTQQAKSEQHTPSAEPRTGAPHRTLPDAFDVALHHAWRRAKDTHTIDGGMRTQQSEGAALDAAITALEREPTLGPWGGRSVGTCSRTWGVPGDCEKGDAGTWRVGAAHGFGVVSIDDCTERCKQCSRCNWISHSHAHQQCDWYHTCNTSKLNRRFGGETFRTRRVKVVEGAE